MSGPLAFSTLANTLKTSVAPRALDMADRISHGMYVVPAGHRFRTIAFSLAFSLAGNGIMHVLTARHKDGTRIGKEEVPFFLRPFHGALEHNEHSDEPEDRWKHVAARAFPIVGAAVGAYVGSRNWAATSAAGAANLNTADEVAAKLANPGGSSITAAEASIYADATRGHISRIVGGVLQALGLHSGIHQLFVPSVLNLGIGLGGAFLGANNRTLNMKATDGLKKSTKDMADHVGRNTYSKVLAELASTPEGEAEARAFLTEMHKFDTATDAGKAGLEKALKQVRDGGGIDRLDAFADRVLNRYFARAAIDYKASIGKVAGDLRGQQDALVKDWLGKIKAKSVTPEGLQKEIETAGAGLITNAFGSYNRKVGDAPLPFLENDFVKTIRKAGFDETKIEIGERNWVYRVFEWMGGGAKGKAEARLQASFGATEAAGRKEFGKAFTFSPSDGSPGSPFSMASPETVARAANLSFPGKVSVPPAKGISPDLGSGLLLAGAGVSMAGMALAKPQETPDLFEGYREREKARGLKGFLDTKVLPKLEFIDRMSIADPSWGRFWLAGGFTLGLMATDYLLQVPFGRTINTSLPNALLPKIEPIPLPQSWRNAWKYDPLSGTDRDRWMKNAHTMAVMAGGAIGTYLGAKWATRDRRSKLHKEPVHLDDFEDRVTFAQGKAWAVPTAISSTPGSALGTTHFGLIPGVNYGANIANFHLLSSGGKITWEGPGKLLMGSQSRYRFGPVKLIDHMIQYAAYNPDEHPKQLVEMASGIVRPWFPDATPEQVNAFVGEVLKARNREWQPGGIAAERKDDLIKELTAQFRGAGLEKTLIGIGLNPAEAKLGNNGLIGTVSEAFGAKKETKELKLDYLKSLEKRYPEQCQARIDRVASASSPVTAGLAAQALAANDRHGGSFASRTASKASPQSLIAARQGQSALQRAELSREAALAPAL